MTAPAEDTDVGGIVAHLRIVGGPEWERDLQRAQRQAEALGRVSPTVRISSNTAELKAQLDELTARLQGIARLNPDVRIRVNNAAVQADLTAIRARLDALGSENTTLRLDLTQAQAQIEALRQRTGRQGGVAGRDFGAQFSRGLRETLAAIPKVEVDADTSDVDRRLAEVRAQMEELSQKRIGVDLSAEDATRALAALQGELQALRAQAGDIDVRFNTATAAARLARLQAQLGAPITPDVDQGRFAAKLARAVKEAAAALPKLDIDADSTPAQRQVAEIRARLVALGEQKIGVDISAAEAAAKLKALQGELDRLSAKSKDDLRIRMDTAAASAKIAALRREMEGLNRAGTGAGSGGGLGTGPLIFGAIIAGASVAGPLVAAATAGAVGLAGAVGVAALAYRGLKDAEDRETSTGEKLKAQFKGIGSELGQLQTIAADRAAPGVLGALSKIRAYIPSLDGPVAGLARHLGNALNTATGGTITALKVMTPLLDDAGGYAEHLAQAFANWTASPQFAQFIAYARRELPIVGGEMADIAGGLIKVGVALQPLGDKMLSFLAIVARGAGDVAALTTSLHDLGIDFGGGPDTVSKDSTGLPKVGRTLGTGAGPNSGSAYFNKGTSPSILEQGGNLVVSTVVGVATGNTQTDKEARKALGVSRPAAIQAAQAAGLVEAYARREEAARQRAAEATKAQEGAQQRLATRYGVTLPVMQAITDASKKDAQARQAAIAKMQQEGNAAGLLKAALDELDGKQLADAQAQNAFEQSLVSMVKATTKADAAVTGLSSSAIQNRANLLASVTAAEAAAGAHGDLAKSSDSAKRKLTELRQQIIDNAVAHGEDRQAVTAYINRVLDINKLKVKPTPLDMDKAAAEKKITALQAQINAIRQGKPTGIAADTELAKRRLIALQAQIDRLQGKNIPVNITVNQSVGRAVHDAVNSIPATRGQAKADGGTVVGEGGPRDDRVLIRASPGEEVIKNGPAQRHRALLKAINAGRFADGGTVGGGIVSITPTLSQRTAAAKKAKKAAKAKDVIDTITVTAGGGSAYGIASYIRGQIPSVQRATQLLSLAVNDAFTLKGLQAKIAGIKTELQRMRDQQQAVASAAEGKLTEGSDPSGFTSIGQFTAYLQAKGNQNARYITEVNKLRANKAIPADLLARFAAAGPSQILDSLAGGSRADIAALVKASGRFDSSVAAGRGQAAAIYGPSIAAQNAMLGKYTAQSARTETAMVGMVLKLAQLVNKPVTVKLDGKTVATTSFVSKELQGVVDELRHLLVTGHTG